MGIPYLGRTVSKAVAKHFKSIDTILDKAGSNSQLLADELESLEGIGTDTAWQITKGLCDLRQEIELLAEHVDVEDMQEVSGSLSGSTFCLTGSFSVKKKVLQDQIEAAGGEIKSGVGKGLTYLVQADPTSTSSKTKKAQQYGVQIIGEDELREMLGV